MKYFFPLVISAASFLPFIQAYGVSGHEIVAAIAQMYLHPVALANVCDILDLTGSRCHLAPVSTWADQNKGRMPWSSALHYINPLDDHPSQSCVFPGSRGWDGKQNINLLDGVKNTTALLKSWVDREVNDQIASEALKFLVHFIGDLHQPMHLTGREKGGNNVKVKFNGKSTNLHSVWDGALLEKFMSLTPSNYSRPLPHPEIEAALRGKDYDPYIRRIMWEGVLDTWKAESLDWFSCNVASSESSSSQKAFMTGVEINPDGPVVCPYFWAKPIHKINCDIAWPKSIDQLWNESNSFATPELDKPEYSGAIGNAFLIEKLLAQGGVRLAGILNYVFASRSESPRKEFLVGV